MALLLRLVFNPFVSGALYFVLSRDSTTILGPLQSHVSEQTKQSLLKYAKYAFILGAVSRVNRYLSRWAENNWTTGNDNKKWNWPDEVVVVTGGSNGIGALVAKMLSNRGAKVAVLDVMPLSEGLKDCTNVFYFHCDLRSREAVSKAAEAVRSELGAPSVLVNNAGIGNAYTILESTPESLHATFDINIISHWYTIQEFLPEMLKRRKGHVVSVASTASFVSPAGMVDYACSKAGLMSLHEGLVQELKHRYGCPEIKTTIVHPNWTRTRLIGPLEADLKKSRAPIMEVDYVAAAIVRQILDGRSGQLVLPPRVVVASMLRATPIWLQEVVRDFTKGFVLAKGTSLGA